MWQWEGIYECKSFFEFAKEKGILIKPCPAYVHELNGTAERYNRTLMDMGRCLLSEAKVERKFWPEVIKSAAYLKNRTLTYSTERKTPYEIFFKRRLLVKILKCIEAEFSLEFQKNKEGLNGTRKQKLEFYLVILILDIECY